MILKEHKKHQKHAKLARPSFGEFSRNEWAIIGTPCGNIKQLAFAIIERLSTQFKIAYVDADHQSADQEAEIGKDKASAMAYGAALEYTDKITFHRFDEARQLSKFQYRQYFNTQDGVVVNGNHFVAKKQIVVIDPNKEKSLERKLDRLTDVGLFVLQNDDQEIYPFLKKELPHWQDIPTLSLGEVEKIAAYIEGDLKNNTAPLYGLVLAGGKSQRMGRDKGLIAYHGIPQRQHLYNIMDDICEKTFVSCRRDQAKALDNLPALIDTFEGLGPFGGILSAFRAYPDAAWLVIACDLPLLDKEALQELVSHRNISATATAFHSPVTDFPEPLIAIWEPRSYSELLQFLAQGYSCPRKVLINANTHIIPPTRPDTLKNINTPSEYEEILALMKR